LTKFPDTCPGVSHPLAVPNHFRLIFGEYLPKKHPANCLPYSQRPIKSAKNIRFMSQCIPRAAADKHPSEPIPPRARRQPSTGKAIQGIRVKQRQTSSVRGILSRS
jgi:hypothetical protein